MGTPRQLTQIAFASPLDESTEDEVLDPAIGFPVLQNVRQDRRGGISKRLGFEARTSDRIGEDARTEGRRCFPHAGTSCVIGNGQLDVYSSLADVSVSAGRVPDVSVEAITLPAVTDTSAALVYDATVANGYFVFVYMKSVGTTSSPWYVVTDIASGVTVKSGSAAGSALSLVQVGTAGTTVYFAHTSFAGSSINLYSLDCTSAATIAAGWVFVGEVAVNKRTSNAAFSMQGLTDRVAIGYVNNSGGASRVHVITCNASGLVQFRAINTSSVTPETVVVAGSIADTLWVAWDEVDYGKVIGLDADSLSTDLATTGTALSTTGDVFITGIAAGTETGKAVVIGRTSPGFTQRAIRTSAGAVAFDSPQTDRLGAYEATQPFVRDGRSYALFQCTDVASAGSPSVCLALCDATDVPVSGENRLRPIANAYPLRAATSETAHAVAFPDGRFGCVVAVTTAVNSIGYALLVYDFVNVSNWRYAEHNSSTFLSGGLLTYLTDAVLQEASFLHPPQNLAVVGSTVQDGPTGAVRYVAIFRALDAAGNLTISGVGNPLSFTGDGTGVILECDPLLMTYRPTVRVEIYRTTENGTIYYRVDSADALQGVVAPTFVDAFTDATLVEQPRLYGTGTLPGTYGGPLQREAPPFCADVVSYNGMLVIASGTDLWWSGQTIGGEGSWFSAEQFFTTVEGEGDITALAVLDGTLYVFKERAIYLVSGEAPNDNGTAGGLGTPRRLAGDVGCISPNSVVVTSLGIFFQSHRGIELVGGGARPVWIGEKILRTLAAFPIVTSAKLDPHNNIVRFSLAGGINSTTGLVLPFDGEGDFWGGRDVIFDLVLNDWQSVDDKEGASEHQASQDACVITVGSESRYAWLGSDGTLYVENDEHLDDGVWITMAAETGWFKSAGIQGRQQVNRLLMLARKRTDCDLSVSLGYTYGEYADAFTWDSGVITSLLTKWPVTQLQHDPNEDGEGQAVRVRVTDAEPTGDDAEVGTGRGATWLALTLDITAKDGPAEVPPEAA